MTEQTRPSRSRPAEEGGEKRRIKITQHKFNILALLFNGNAAAKQRELLRETRERGQRRRQSKREKHRAHRGSQL